MEKKSLLAENEKLLFAKLSDNDVNETRRIVAEGNIRIDCLDEHGMSPLQHAAYKGNYDLCKLLLKHGADINIPHHEHKYTTLMFAALSGKKDVVGLLLENGASTLAVNSINKTASQLAAFVGNHEIVVMINNFISQEEIDWYTVIQKNQSEPKLPPELAHSTHQLVIKTNIHPVHLAIFLQATPVLLKESNKVCRTLEHLSGRQFNDSNNDMMSMKLHHISFVLRFCAKYLANTDLSSNSLEPLIKHWIKSDENGSLPLNLEQFVRKSIKQFPFQECPLLHQFVRTLAPIEVGSEPSALSVFIQGLRGQRPLEDENEIACSTCMEAKAEKKCSVCKTAYYCNKYCQKLHWFTHKLACPNLAIEYENACKISENQVQKEDMGDSVQSDLTDADLNENLKKIQLDAEKENLNSENVS